MIKTLHLRNFKCFASQSFRLGHLTLLTGLNGAGKSTVLQSLLLLRQSKLDGLLDQTGLSLNGALVQLGTARDIFYEDAEEDAVWFRISKEFNIQFQSNISRYEQNFIDLVVHDENHFIRQCCSL